jgi:hypothetical protein
MARGYPDVRASTVASFALNDYEWILTFEAHELHRIVDLMRDLRGSGARRHVREEVPFFTGRRRSIREILATLPSHVLPAAARAARAAGSQVTWRSRPAASRTVASAGTGRWCSVRS